MMAEGNKLQPVRFSIEQVRNGFVVYRDTGHSATMPIPESIAASGTDLRDVVLELIEEWLASRTGTEEPY